jgi:ParB/RepB/Spo0J family partition protein
VSWQPGDVSPDARRAAESAAEAAGVPLKDWVADAVRAAVIRELGRIPDEPKPEPPARPRAPTAPMAPAAEPVVSLPIAKPARARAPAPPPEPIASEPIAAAPPPEPAEIAEPVAPEPMVVAPRPAPAEIAEPEPAVAAPSPPEPTEIAEPEPFIAVPVATAEPPAPAAVTEPEPLAPEPIAAVEPLALTPAIAPATPSPAAREAPRIAADATHRVEPQRLTDPGFSSWLATRIQGLPTRTPSAIPSVAKDAPPIAPPPSPLAPTPPRLDPLPLARTTAPPARQPALREPAPLRTAPTAPTAASTTPPALPQPSASQPELPLPLSLPPGPVMNLRLSSLRPARIRARRPMDADPAIAVLAESIASRGVREPIRVRRLAENADLYEVIAGERRRLAAERAGRTDLPAIIVDADDTESLLVSLTENLGRPDFSPLDEARTYLRLLTEYRMSPSALAQRLSRERTHIALALRLLGLPPTVRQLIDDGRLTAAQVYALPGAADPEAMAEQMIQAAAGGATRDSG